MHTLYTAGYTGTTPDALLATAERLDALLVDIRISPVSRVEHWTGRNLERAWGKRYIHLRALGNRNYKQPHLGVQLMDVAGGIKALYALLEQHPCIILCACENHETCHRQAVADVMIERFNATIIHLSKRDIMNPPRQRLRLF